MLFPCFVSTRDEDPFDRKENEKQKKGERNQSGFCRKLQISVVRRISGNPPIFYLVKFRIVFRKRIDPAPEQRFFDDHLQRPFPQSITLIERLFLPLNAQVDQDVTR